MTVVCKMVQCPFYCNDFCSKEVVGIDVNGHCSQLWKNGQPRQGGLDYVEEQFKNKPVIIEGEWKDVKDERIIGEDGGSGGIIKSTEGRNVSIAKEECSGSNETRAEDNGTERGNDSFVSPDDGTMQEATNPD